MVEKENLQAFGFRLPQSVVDRIDAFAEQRAKEAGVPVSRSAAIRLLLERGLEAEQAKSKRRK